MSLVILAVREDFAPDEGDLREIRAIIEKAGHRVLFVEGFNVTLVPDPEPEMRIDPQWRPAGTDDSEVARRNRNTYGPAGPKHEGP